MRHWSSRRRAACGFLAVGAAAGLVALGPLRATQADDGGIDQVSGNGATVSALTVKWDDGLLGADNKVVTPRDPNSPYAFMYDDFKGLTVTVSQTENLVRQPIQVTWSGGKPTNGGNGTWASDYLQMMECYGDANTGPLPENCEYGSVGLLNVNQIGSSVRNRSGLICTGPPDTVNPPGSTDGGLPILGCDPAEADTGPAHRVPGGNNAFYSVPFVPVFDPTHRIYDQQSFPFNQFNSNEVQAAPTRPDGTGEVFFNALTTLEAPGLGCGAPEGNGKPRGCWLVIVPRGEYQANGQHVGSNPGNITGWVNGSPLGAADWAQRIQIHLGYTPLQPICDIGSAAERQMVGTQLVSNAVFSWQVALNTASKCRVQYGFSATPEASSTSEIGTDTGIGFAFTTVPIGDEKVRDGQQPPPLPSLVYAPVAVSAITFGFTINGPNGFVSTPVKLTPRLLAKALTQSYKNDLPDVGHFTGGQGPDWAQHNPVTIMNDPEFIKLNPNVGVWGPQQGMAPLLTADRSGINEQVWAWIQSDPAARAWLSGTPDENGMVVNPNYKKLKLGQPPAFDSFPRADPTCFNTAPQNTPESGQKPEPGNGRCSIDLLPYVENFDDASSRVQSANDPEGADWSQTVTAPDGTPWWWAGVGIEPPGSQFMWTVGDSANLTRYGLVAAQLCKSDGTGCTSPTTATVGAALSHAKTRRGLSYVDPATPGSGGYPLVDITYAAVRATQPPDVLNDYASFIAYAVSHGQTPGVDPGQLPRGYLPLTSNLRTEAMQAVSQLRALAGPSPSSTTPGASDTGTQPSEGTVPNAGGLPSVGVSGLPYAISQATPLPAAQNTDRVPVGPVRWALLTVLLTGLGGSVGGPLFRTMFSRRPKVPKAAVPSTSDGAPAAPDPAALPAPDGEP